MNVPGIPYCENCYYDSGAPRGDADTGIVTAVNDEGVWMPTEQGYDPRSYRNWASEPYDFDW